MSQPRGFPLNSNRNVVLVENGAAYKSMTHQYQEKMIPTHFSHYRNLSGSVLCC